MSAQYRLGDTIHVAGVLHVVIGYSEISGQLVTVTRTLIRVPNIYVEFEPLGPVRSVVLHRMPYKAPGKAQDARKA